MTNISRLAGTTVLFVLTGCATLQTGGEVAMGRTALVSGRPDIALVNFSRAAELNPGYVFGDVFREGIWTYVGRANYEVKNYQEARRALETAISRNADDSMAHLYLGLTLAREGDRQRGLQEIQTGLRGLYDWLEWISTAHRYNFGRFWDPTREIRSQIQAELAIISRIDIEPSRLIAGAEQIGARMEEEVDRATREEKFFIHRGGDNRDSA